MIGIINVFKPKEMTSHDIVNIIRKKFDIKRVGHTGTLDPDVTGVLPICIGRATRVSEYILNGDKVYIGELTLGYKTDTQDYSGSILASSNEKVSKEEIIKVFKSFIGTIEQIPPMYSAVRYKGIRLHQLAREQIEVKRDPRIIEIYDLNILDINENNNKILFEVKCSKGTYIRTLCNDIGEKLGNYGYLSFLMRTEVENFKLNNALGIETIREMPIEKLTNFILPMDLALKNLKKLNLEDNYYRKLSNGLESEINIDLIKGYKSEEEISIYIENDFLGIGKIIERDNKFFIKMTKVLKFR